MLPRPLVLWTIALAAATGCLAQPAADEPSGSGWRAPPQVELSSADFSAGATAVEMVLSFPSGGTVDVRLANGRAERRADAAQECGTVAATRGGDDEGFVASWMESSGRALTVSAAGESRQVNGSGTAGKTDGTIAVNGSREFEGEVLPPGGRLVLRIGMGAEPSGLYDPRIRVSGLPPDVAITRAPLAFRCGAGLGGFEGTLAQGGAFFGPTFVRGAALEQAFPVAGEAEFVWWSDPRTEASHCDLAVELDGKVVDEAVEDAADCVVAAKGPAGNWRFVIREAAGAGPVVAWWLVADEARAP